VADLDGVAESVLADHLLATVLEGLDPTGEDVRAVLDAAW